MPETKTVRTSTLDIAYEETGPTDGSSIVLLHGFPDDIRAWDATAPALAEAGYRVLVPYLRGCGPTRFVDTETPRSGEQAAIGEDVREFLDCLKIERAMLAGYDWGGRAACVAAALWPERIGGLVTTGGYHIQNIDASVKPSTALNEYRYWYQWYLMSERGRTGLEGNGRELCQLMWRLWSPNWQFDDAQFERTAQSFDNPDFVDVVLHSYRHRNGAAPGFKMYEAIQKTLAAQPKITVPSIILHGEADGVTPPENSASHGRFFTDLRRRTVVPTAGHFLPREAPDAVVEALVELGGAAASG